MKGRRVKQKAVVPPWPIPVGGLPLIWDEWQEGIRMALRSKLKSDAGRAGTRP
jgi:hypothetical protein